MTLELLIQSLVRQTTLLIARLATAGGARAPLAQVADQVFIDLVRELEREGVSRRVSADMFGLGLRTYQRKIRRLSESRTDRGRSLWEAVLEYVRSQGIVTRAKVMVRFANDDDSQVRGVLHDLGENRLVFSSGTGPSAIYRAASDEDLRALGGLRPEDGLDELIWAFLYRMGPAGVGALSTESGIETEVLESALERLVSSGRAEVETGDAGNAVYRSSTLVIPVDAAVGWEAAVFDHFKAVVNTITARLAEEREGAVPGRVGGSTFTLEVWPGHPEADEVYGTLARLRRELGELRRRVDEYNAGAGVPEEHDRVVLYAGQHVVSEGNGEEEAT